MWVTFNFRAAARDPRRAGSVRSGQRTVTWVSYAPMPPIFSDMRPNRIGVLVGG